MCQEIAYSAHLCSERGRTDILRVYFGSVESDVTRVVVVSNAIGPFSETFKDNITIKKSTASGGRMKEVNERSFIFVHQHGGDDVT